MTCDTRTMSRKIVSLRQGRQQSRSRQIPCFWLLLLNYISVSWYEKCMKLHTSFPTLVFCIVFFGLVYCSLLKTKTKWPFLATQKQYYWKIPFLIVKLLSFEYSPDDMTMELFWIFTSIPAVPSPLVRNYQLTGRTQTQPTHPSSSNLRVYISSLTPDWT